MSAQHTNTGMDVETAKKKRPVYLIWPLLSLFLVVYSFHLLHVIQKHLQVNLKFRGQATELCASSGLVHGRVGNW